MPPTTNKSLSPARRALAEALEAVEALAAPYRAASDAIDAIRPMLAAPPTHEAALASAEAEQAAAIAAWARSGGKGPQPVADARKLASLRQALDQANATAKAARASLEDLEADVAVALARRRAALLVVEERIQGVLAEEAEAVVAEAVADMGRLTARVSSLVALLNTAIRKGDAGRLAHNVTLAMMPVSELPVDFSQMQTAEKSWARLWESLRTNPAAS